VSEGALHISKFVLPYPESPLLAELCLRKKLVKADVKWPWAKKL
jgi:hypothetical protein